MSIIPKEVLKQLVRAGAFKDSSDILNFLKDMLKDVLQETMEAELEQSLDYEKYDCYAKSIPNS